jgi:hypothetical protein
LGNDSALALSTGAASVTGTLAVSSTATFSGTTAVSSAGGTSQMRIDRSGSVARMQNYDTGSAANISLQHDGGNVGIGTAAPEAKVHLNDISTGGPVGMYIRNSAGSTLNNSADIYFGTWGGSAVAGVTNARISAVNVNAGNAESNIDFYTYNGSASGKRVSITSNGLTFNGDTAQANALDDYEEGTWTMGVAFGGASAGVTYGLNTGTYTKIGRQVTVNGYLTLTSKGSSTGAAAITGLPFTIANNAANYSAATLQFYDITFTNQFQGYGVTNATTIDLREITILGVNSALTNSDFADSSGIILSLTYFV